MNWSKRLPLFIIILLIGCSLAGLFEERALVFVKGVFVKNLRFMELVMEVKLISSGIGSIKLPIVEGIAKEVSNGVDFAMKYLLVTDILSFCQVLLLTVSKSWLLKTVTLCLFVLSFFQSTKTICTKLLIVSLAVSPGLAIFSSGVEILAGESSIDFGAVYLKKLESKVKAAKSEHAQLSKQHQRDLTKVKNGEKGIHILQSFREHVSDDFNKPTKEISGPHFHIRRLLHKDSHEMKSKIYGFCSMVLFCMLLLPLGYAYIVYLMISSLFAIPSQNVKAQVGGFHYDFKLRNYADLKHQLKSTLVAYQQKLRGKEKTAAQKVKNDVPDSDNPTRKEP
ncbi:MAG: hypothetical protein AAGA66_01185 [Bacteroidota bacterium]